MLINEAAEEFRRRMIAIQCIDRDVIERAGVQYETSLSMMRDPLGVFQRMAADERSKFWPLVDAYLEDQSERARDKLWMGKTR